MNLNPHLCVAGGVVLVGLLVTVGPLTSFPVSGTISERTFKVPSSELRSATSSTVDVRVATTAIVPEYSRQPDYNPFVGRKSSEVKVINVPKPPAPPLDPPAPPLLPIPEK